MLSPMTTESYVYATETSGTLTWKTTSPLLDVDIFVTPRYCPTYMSVLSRMALTDSSKVYVIHPQVSYLGQAQTDHHKYFPASHHLALSYHKSHWSCDFALPFTMLPSLKTDLGTYISLALLFAKYCLSPLVFRFLLYAFKSYREKHGGSEMCPCFVLIT